MLADEIETEKTRGEPEHGRQEGECDVGLPLVAGALVGYAAPVKGGAAVEWADELPSLSDTISVGTNDEVRSELTSTRRPKATIQATKRRRSTGQWMKAAVNGRSHNSARRIERPAITSV